MILDPATFERSLQVRRGFGRVFCDWRARTHEGEPGADELDEYAATVLGEVHDDQWRGGYRQISARYAHQLAAFWLVTNLEAGTPPAGTDPKSPAIEPFFGLFTAEPLYFTNASGQGPSSTKTLHDWDAGIVVVDRIQIGLLWFADDE